MNHISSYETEVSTKIFLWLYYWILPFLVELFTSYQQTSAIFLSRKIRMSLCKQKRMGFHNFNSIWDEAEDTQRCYSGCLLHTIRSFFWVKRIHWIINYMTEGKSCSAFTQIILWNPQKCCSRKSCTEFFKHVYSQQFEVLGFKFKLKVQRICRN